MKADRLAPWDLSRQAILSAHRISVVITSYNEGEELGQTLRSVIDNTHGLLEVIVVDDGSTDGSSDVAQAFGVRVIRHEERIGVAYSRDEASLAARGDIICYLDAHQRVGRHCLDECACIASERNVITSPDIRGFGRLTLRLRGADFQLCPKHSYFSANWRLRWGLNQLTAVTALRAPPYLIPRRLYPRIAWSQSLRSWGGSEASVSVKSFFSAIEIVHVRGPLARHRFQRAFSYDVTWEDMWRNQAIIARVCFDDATWFRHWLPNVFQAHLSRSARHSSI